MLLLFTAVIKTVNSRYATFNLFTSDTTCFGVNGDRGGSQRNSRSCPGHYVLKLNINMSEWTLTCRHYWDIRL